MGKLLIYLVAFGALLFFGWDQPLRYRFMSAQEVAADKGEDDEPEEPPRIQTMRNWQPMGTSLDRAPYEVKSGKVKYSANFDPRKTGSASETDYRRNTKRIATMAEE